MQLDLFPDAAVIDAQPTWAALDDQQKAEVVVALARVMAKAAAPDPSEETTSRKERDDV